MHTASDAAVHSSASPMDFGAVHAVHSLQLDTRWPSDAWNWPSGHAVHASPSPASLSAAVKYSPALHTTVVVVVADDDVVVTEVVVTVAVVLVVVVGVVVAVDVGVVTWQP